MAFMFVEMPPAAARYSLARRNPISTSGIGKT